jgi:class 3 adenylate cyclase
MSSSPGRRGRYGIDPDHCTFFGGFVRSTIRVRLTATRPGAYSPRDAAGWVHAPMINGKAGGIAVHIGARVGALAGPSEVLVSQTVKELVAGSGLTFEDAGEHELKGVPDRWRLYRVVA